MFKHRFRAIALLVLALSLGPVERRPPLAPPAQADLVYRAEKPARRGPR